MFKRTIFVLTLVFLITAGLGCKGLSKEQQAAVKPITLNYWRVYDDSDSFAEVIAAYKTLHPNIDIIYRKLRPEEFERELLNALAEDKGPDIFSIQNTWVGAYQSKIYPLPPVLKVAFQRTVGTYQKKLVVDVKDISTLTLKQLREQYLAVVNQDAVRTALDPKTNQSVKAIYGLPLSVDVLALYYNKDLLDRAGIAEAPKTWEDFQKDVKLLTKISSNNEVLQAGAALGRGKNVLRSADILSLLMMQNGAVMTTEAGAPTFQLMPQGVELPTPPAAQALQFYTDFADSTKEVYTWNEKMPESLDAFVRGQSAFFFGYAYHLPYIRSRAPKLNFDIAPVPQVNQSLPANFASYWLETVSRKTAHPDEAWDFLLFASNAKNVVNYLNKVKKPAALRALIANQLEDADLSAFAKGLLTAQSWHRGRDAQKAEEYFTEMIENVFKAENLNDPAVYQKAVNNAAAKIGQTL